MSGLLQGTVAYVTQTLYGSVLTAAASTGDTTVTIADITDFLDADGGLVDIGQTGAAVAYTTATANDTDTGGTLTLAAELAADVAAGARVDLWTASEPVCDWQAVVLLADGFPATADLPMELVDLLGQSPPAALDGATVEIAEDDDGFGYVVRRLIGRTPSRDLAFAKDSSLPPTAVDDAAWGASNKAVDLLNNAADQSALTIVGASIATGQPGSGVAVASLSGVDGLNWSDPSIGASIQASAEAGNFPILRGAIVEIESGIAKGNLEVRSNLEMSPGSRFVFATQVPAPPAPTLTKMWPSVATDAMPVYDLNKCWCFYDDVFWAQWYVDDDWWLVSIDPATGTQTKQWQIGDIDVRSIAHNDDGWWLLIANGSGALALTNLDDDFEATSNPVTLYTPLGSLARPAITAYDSTSIAIADFADDARQVRIAVYTDGDTTPSRNIVLFDLPSSWTGVTELASICRGEFDYSTDGSELGWIIAPFGVPAPVLVAADAHTGGWRDQAKWPVANGDLLSGIDWDGSKFVSLSGPSSAPYLASYSGLYTDDLAEPFWVAGTWYQAAAPYETVLGQSTKITFQNRVTVRADFGTMPGARGDDDPDRCKVYITNQGSGYHPTWYEYVVTGDQWATYADIVTVPESGTGPPDEGTFPTGPAAKFVLSDGTTVVVEITDDGQIFLHNGADPVDDQDFVTKAYGDANYSGSGDTAWGDITGTLSDQTDLETALGGKVATSRQVISGTGLTGGGDLTADRTLAVTYGTSSGTACEGDDSRLSDSRAPSGTAGGDLTGTYPSPTIGSGKVTAAKIASATITATQIASGTITGLNIASSIKDAAAATASLRTLGTGSAQACAGNDSRLSDSRTPTAHASTHASGGTDPVSPSSIGALDASDNLSDVDDAATARTNLGLGTAATQDASAFDASGAADTAQANAEAYTDDALASPTWTTVSTLSNGWSTQGSDSMQYTRDALGIVHMRGRVKGGTAGATAFTLPSGYTPSQGVYKAVVGDNGATALLNIGTAGAVKPTLPTGAAWVALELDFPTW